MRALPAITVLLSLLSGCENPDLIRNPLVDYWCGDHPCFWQVEGEIERTGTWHEKDYAISFVSDDARMSQLNGALTADVTDCFDFTMLAKIEEGVDLYLELDFLDDGELEFSERILESQWDRRRFLIRTPSWYEGVRFILRKDGPGYAALAQLSASWSDECSGPPLDLRNRPEGVACEENEQCSVGACDDGVCGGCGNDADCESGLLCGLARSYGKHVSACVTEGSRVFGDACHRGVECATGVCCDGACSTCCDGAPCPDAQDCAPVSSELANLPPEAELYLPWLCAAGEGLGEIGAICTEDADCASGACNGGGLVCGSGACDGDDCNFSWCVTPHVTGGACE